MTASEALAAPGTIADIVDQCGRDKRTVKRVLAGDSPWGKAWRAVERAATALGVTGLPAPRARLPLSGGPQSGPCAGCAAEREKVAKLTAEIARASKHVSCGECCGACGRWDEEAQDQWYDCSACDGTGLEIGEHLVFEREKVAELERQCASKDVRISDLEIIVGGVRAERDSARAACAELEGELTEVLAGAPSSPEAPPKLEAARQAATATVLPMRPRAPAPEKRQRMHVLLGDGAGHETPVSLDDLSRGILPGMEPSQAEAASAQERA